MNTQKMAAVFAMIIMLALSLAACQPQPAVVETVVVTQVVTEREEVVVTQEVIITQEVVVTPEPQIEETTLERVQREGVVRVGFANENPYAFAQPDGTLSGEAVEVARAVFTALGIDEMEGVLTQFGSLIPGLQARRFDVITAGMFINPTRCEQVLFADPEYKIGEGLIVEAGNPLDLHSYEDIAANPDVRIGTGAGYLEHDYLLAVGVSEDQITTYPDDPSGVAGLQAGQIDAWTATTPTLLKVLETTGDQNLEMADPFTDPVIDGQPVTGYGAAAFRPEDQDFRDAFNAELQKLKDSGELVEIIGQFEGFGPQNDPGDVTAEELCQP